MEERSRESKAHGNVKIDLPASLNDPKFERTDLEYMTDEYKREIGR